ncbi:MAG: DUF2169 domain-containing protein [Sandaracinaceae bacterium]
MEVRCHSPFVPQVFKSKDKHGTPHDVFVVKATYDIVEGRRIKISQEQEPLTMADDYFGEVNVTSVSRESDLAPFKPRTDLVVVGDAHAPGGRPTASWIAEVRMGEVRKAIRVTGPRRWRRNLRMFWNLSDPEPVTTVPVRYENAFGGLFRRDEEKVDAFRQNPVGRGWAPETPPESEIAAPQVEDALQPIEDFGKEYTPAGFGFIGRSWTPRLELAGTYDDAWKENQWPLSPLDWDDAHNNGAHPDLQLDGYLRGGEPFRASHMSPGGSVEFTVPRWQVDIRIRYRNGVIETHPTCLDTCVVDLPSDKVLFTYRLRVPEAAPIRVAEVCMREDG